MEEKKKVVIKIAGSEFKVVTSEGENYTKELAKKVDDSIKELCRESSQTSVTAAAILTALNFCDKNLKYEEEAEKLGKQLECYFEEISLHKRKCDELRSENEKLKRDIETLRGRLASESPTINEPFPISSSVKLLRKTVSVSEQEEAAEDEQAFFDNVMKGNINVVSDKNDAASIDEILGKEVKK